jgi:hypothetical protein
MPKPLTQKTWYKPLHSEVLLEKLTVPELVEKLPTFYTTRGFTTVSARARQMSLSRAQVSSHPISLRSVSQLPSHLWLGLPSGLFPSCFPTKPSYARMFSLSKFTSSAHNSSWRVPFSFVQSWSSWTFLMLYYTEILKSNDAKTSDTFHTILNTRFIGQVFILPKC